MKTNLSDFRGVKFETIQPNNDKRINLAFISIGNGRLDINSTACKMLNNYQRYNWAEFHKGEKNNDLYCIAIKFYEEPTDYAVKISHKIAEGKAITGMSINSKDIIRNIFGADGIANKTLRISNISIDAANDLLFVKL